MNRTVSLFLFVVLISSCSEDGVAPTILVDKHIRIEFYTDKDATDPRYENCEVQVYVGAMKMTYTPYVEEYFLDETTDWIAFKDLPDTDRRMVFEVVIPDVDAENQSVVIGYSYGTRLGAHTEFLGRSVHLQKGELSKTVVVVI